MPLPSDWRLRPVRCGRIAPVMLGVALGAAAVAGAQAPTPKPIENPTPADLERGAVVFTDSCARCHGLDGSGGAGPRLARPRLSRAVDEAAIIDIVLNGIPGTARPALWMLPESDAARVAAYVRSLGRRLPEPLPGDPAAGRALYGRLGCATCHVVDGVGTAVGPELSAIGRLRGAAFLRESLLDPAAARPERGVKYEPYAYPAYVTVRVKPRAAPEVAGLLVNEDSFTLQLRDQAGRVRSFRKADLKGVQRDRASPMPSFREALIGRDADDLVAYLMTLGAQP
jgi:putative heme-binding domain-containing protein